MHSPAASTSALPPIESHEIDRISAYYSLAFPNFTYYLQTLTVTIGRRPIPSATSSDVSLVDVDLGPLKSVSRLHARIEYEEEEERFVLVVLGRNGAWVDGIWAGSGSKVPLGARSQIQIATRTFHFILPPPPEPESTSLSPPPSTARQRSPSVDITSLSAGSSHSASPQPTARAVTVTDNPASTSSKPAKFTKKRKRPEPDQPPPEKMPPKPLATYAVMCYRAITSLGGKATLQDVIQWMIDNYEWYRLNVGGPWENSIRHNLSSNRAFRNMARSPDERGKGFMWGIDPKSEQGLRDQDAKTRQAELDRQHAQTAAVSAPAPAPLPKPQPPPKPVFTKEPLTKSANAKEKKPALSSPALTKLPKASVNSTVSSNSVPVVAEPTPPLSTTAFTTPTASSSLLSDTSLSIPGPSNSSTSSVLQMLSNVSIPIVVAPLPDSHPATSAPTAALASTDSPAAAVITAPPIVLHAGTLILDPTIFSHLTPEHLKELEGLGAQKAVEILQGHLVRFLKEKMKSEGSGRSRGRIRVRGRGGASGRVAGKGPRKDDKQSMPDTGPSDSKPVSRDTEGQGEKGSMEPCSPVEPAKASKSSLQSLACKVNGQPQMNGLNTTAEGPPMKKRKMDTDVTNVDVEIDIVGT